MEKNLQDWIQKTNAIWLGVLMFSIAGIIFDIVSGMASITTIAGNLMSQTGFYGFIMFMVLITVIMGYALYVMGLKNLRDILDYKDSDAIGRIYVGAIIIAISYVWLLFGFWGWIATALKIVALLFMMIGFMSLKNSETFPAKARKGASNLFITMILALIGCALSFLLWIPILGYVIGAIANVFILVSYILVLVGWSQIKAANPDELT